MLDNNDLLYEPDNIDSLYENDKQNNRKRDIPYFQKENTSRKVDKQTYFDGNIDNYVKKNVTDDNEIELVNNNVRDNISKEYSSNFLKEDSFIENNKSKEQTNNLELPIIQSPSHNLIVEKRKEGKILPELSKKAIVEITDDNKKNNKKKQIETKNTEIENKNSLTYEREKIDLSKLNRLQLIKYYKKLKKEFLFLTSFLQKKKDLEKIKKETSYLDEIYKEMDYIFQVVKPENQEDEIIDEEIIDEKNNILQKEIATINQEIKKYEKEINNFLSSPDGIYKLILSTQKESKSERNLIHFQEQYNIVVENYSNLVDKIEKYKKYIQINEEKINKLTEMKSNLELIANEKYNLNVYEDSYSVKKNKSKLVTLRKKNQQEYGEHYMNKNILQNEIEQKEREKMNKMRKIYELEKILKTKTEEAKNAEQLIQNIYNPIHLGQNNQKINERDELESKFTFIKSNIKTNNNNEEKEKNIIPNNIDCNKSINLLSPDKQEKKYEPKVTIQKDEESKIIPTQISQSSRRRPNFQFKFSDKKDNIYTNNNLQNNNTPPQSNQENETIENNIKEDIAKNASNNKELLIHREPENAQNKIKGIRDDQINVNNYNKSKEKPSFLDPEFDESINNEDNITENKNLNNSNSKPSNISEHKEKERFNIHQEILGNTLDFYGKEKKGEGINEFEDLEEVIL